MSILNICNRTSEKGYRIKMENVELEGKIAEFKIKTAMTIDMPIHELELVYCGKVLKDQDTLESYGIKPGVTVHVLKRPEAERQVEVPEPLDRTGVQQVVTALQAALLNPAYRDTVERMLQDTEALENIMAATPGLDTDPVALAMLQDPELLAILADPNHIHRVIEAHPALGQAAMLVAAAVNEEGIQGGGGSSATGGRGTYSLDQMSDDEDMMSMRPPQASGGQTITAGQLAAALASAAGVPQPSTSSGAQGNSQSSTQAESSIGADFFQQAMMQAVGGETASTPSQSAENTDAQLQQLRDMGITDESVARQALEATGGNLQAALELLFGDGGFP